ncbi:Bacteriophage abortive infection AbiH [Flavobacterium succinicans]|uniref:Bacteriophage abortive infection AbiH n=1 Tax=Flavobacterium succinicans TaxID=29536 RepID=A0A1I4UYS1_9FLAO|nr:AbiH family protein [Flavobacterium succinicans]SFM94025.1 Bacteriophage abortive infection AbiH [Flavobacterium succinicans]
MNRLFIIGNGFDLAHGLPTSYKHFIDDFWRNFRARCKSEKYKNMILTDDGYTRYYEGYTIIKNFNDLKDNLRDYSNEYGYSFNLQGLICRDGNKVVFQFNNIFFKIITEMNSENWVDIENLYYNILKSILNSNSKVQYNYPYGVKRLNEEFEQVKNLLEAYLEEKVEAINVIPDIVNLFKIESALNKYALEFSKEDYNELEEFYTKYNPDLEEGKNVLNYFLNFNYTRTIDKYIKETKEHKAYREFGDFTNIQIHGRLNDRNNLVNFGFGDEMDDDYKRIENLDDNEYLKNFKSFQYLQNSNYKKLLDFIDTNKFQVVILGHSCGLSDRTLLNTIFEHTNCRSIKVYYHQKDDGSDNYTEIIQNISRHFNKKKLMREKIVNKTLCKLLPQIQLPLIK